MPTNTMKLKLLLVAALALFVGASPAVSYAAYDDVTLGSTDTLITVGGVTLTVAAPSAVLESIDVGSDNFTVIMPGNSFLRVTSTSRRTLSTSGSPSVTMTSSCTDSLATNTFDSPAVL